MKTDNNKIKKLRKYHKWPGLIISFILTYYAISGILMNHREFISEIDINRNALSEDYHYKNWNLAALKGNEIISKDSILIYGNIGIWLTDSSHTKFTDLNAGFPKGIDNRKIFDVHFTPQRNLYAATLFGLYVFDFEINEWQKIDLDVDIKRFVALESKNDTIIAMNRSYIFAGKDNGANTTFYKTQIKEPLDYENKISLFETIWQIHSGEVFGMPGKLFVDFMGILVIILSMTGNIYFFFPRLIKRRKQKEKVTIKLVSTNKYSIKWHNKVGAWFIAALIILTLTGMFLRPPLLLTIARADIPALKFTHLDQPNPWYDDLRDILYDTENDSYVLATYKGIYNLKNFTSIPEKYEIQPPVSVMGINVLKKYDNVHYLIGSFSGLYLWNPESANIYNYISKVPYTGTSFGKPFGQYSISGIISNSDNTEFIVDYEKGILNLDHSDSFPEMPENIIKESPLSLWSLSLEIHTGRIFNFLLSGFYILIVPLTGIISLIVIVSGYLIYRKKKKKRS